MAKGFWERFGHLWGAFLLAKKDSIDYSEMVEFSPASLTAEHKNEFIEWLGLPENATAKDRKEAAEALETIWGLDKESEETWIGQFNKGKNSVIKESEEVIKESEEVEEKGPSSFQEVIEGVEFGESIPAPGTPEYDVWLNEKHAVILYPGVPREEIQAYIIAQEAEGNLDAEEIARLTAFANAKVLRPQKIGDTEYLAPYAGHFLGVQLDSIIDNYASYSEILAYQTALMDNNVVPQNYFNESLGQYSEKLRTSVQMVMNWIDTNIYAGEDTQLYAEIMNQTENAPVYFTKLQQDNKDFSFARNLFNYGLKEIISKQQILDEVAEAEAARDIAKDFIPPSDSTLDDMVEGWFEAKLNRNPTEEELDIWSTRLAGTYSKSFAQQRAANRALESYNFMVSQPEYAGLSSQEVKDLKKQYPGTGNVDLSQFSTQTPGEIATEEFEGEYEGMIEDVEQAESVRKMQQDMMTYMFGGA
tara:strand:- start:1111 stop:2532 length:1422 start_codon:yes stop_codon:yes gene_type:complete